MLPASVRLSVQSRLPWPSFHRKPCHLNHLPADALWIACQLKQGRFQASKPNYSGSFADVTINAVAFWGHCSDLFYVLQLVAGDPSQPWKHSHINSNGISQSPSTKPDIPSRSDCSGFLHLLILCSHMQLACHHSEGQPQGQRCYYQLVRQYLCSCQNIQVMGH